VEDAEVGEQYTVVPVQEGDQDLSANDDAGIDDSMAEQSVDGFAFSAVTAPYNVQPEVIYEN